jgi:hypothetical protein
VDGSPIDQVMNPVDAIVTEHLTGLLGLSPQGKLICWYLLTLSLVEKKSMFFHYFFVEST